MNKAYYLAVDISESVCRHVVLTKDDAEFLMKQGGFEFSDCGGLIHIAKKSPEDQEETDLLDPADCKHGIFAGDIEVCRVTKKEDGPVVGYEVCVKVNCAQCEQAFAFTGLPGGALPDKPTMNPDGTEARLPISPSNGEIRVMSMTYKGMGDQPGRG